MKSEDRFFSVMEQVEALQEKQRANELRNESIDKAERKILNVINVIQLLFMFCVISSPFIWIWLGFSLFCKVLMAGLIGGTILYYFEKWVKEIGDKKRNKL